MKTVAVFWMEGRPPRRLLSSQTDDTVTERSDRARVVPPLHSAATRQFNLLYLQPTIISSRSRQRDKPHDLARPTCVLND
jgi:hypothetical protein